MKQLTAIFLVCAMLFSVSNAIGDRISDEAVQIFGSVENSKRISNGAVFIDGLYIRAPYTLTRKGNGIFVNNRLAQKFPVSSEPPASTPAAGKNAAPQNDLGDLGVDDLISNPKPAAKEKELGSAGSENYISDKEGASLGGNKKPQKESSDAPKLVTDKKDEFKRLNKPAVLSSQRKVKYDYEALFEESDYTYSPMKKPEPKAVPYVRPQSQATTKELLEAAKKREADAAAKRKEAADARKAAAAELEGDAPAIVEADDAGSNENFDGITPERIKKAQTVMNARIVTYEKALADDKMIIFSGTVGTPSIQPEKTMSTFIRKLPDAFKNANSADNFAAMFKNLALKSDFLENVYKNRTSHERDITFVVRQIEREEEARRKELERRRR